MAQHYIEAGRILDKLLSKSGPSLKNLLYGGQNKSHIPTIYALVTETLKYKNIIDEILNNCGIYEDKLNKGLKGSGHVLHVMVYDLLISSKQKISGGGRLKKTLMRHKSAMHAALVRLKIKAKVTETIGLVPDHLKENVIIPRYVRINTHKTTLEEVINTFQTENYEFVDSVIITDVTNAEQSKKHKIMKLEEDIPETYMLSFPPFTDFHSHELVTRGHIILQDKASALSGGALLPPPNCIAIDACAAPGMKTMQLSESMQNTGTLYAFDRDPKRLATLKRITRKHGCNNIKARVADFLSINHQDEDYKNVEYILLDPSCSGSGIVSRLDYLLSSAMPEQELDEDEETEEQRLASLSGFQIQALRHALSFPRVNRVVYSTCSIHQIENEDVVQQALEEFPDFELIEIYPNWTNRGIEGLFPNSHFCVRASPKEDRTIGFFVSCFQRKIALPPLPKVEKKAKLVPDNSHVVQEVQRQEVQRKVEVVKPETTNKKRKAPTNNFKPKRKRRRKKKPLVK
eukprot:TRINITY_DN2589_c0_g1_i2.p1 TRINITY_DN2589_c0_g1~~TRINITY_DN2589_c0_g1_i2.p1  ORF type:complete len:516 (+),score=102.04 TRINITY_DN2589_c0_g1_i2:11-1558(+)